MKCRLCKYSIEFLMKKKTVFFVYRLNVLVLCFRNLFFASPLHCSFTFFFVPFAFLSSFAAVFLLKSALRCCLSPFFWYLLYLELRLSSWISPNCTLLICFRKMFRIYSVHCVNSNQTYWCEMKIDYSRVFKCVPDIHTQTHTLNTHICTRHTHTYADTHTHTYTQKTEVS